MPIQWAQESCDRRDDPVSGARIIQLTSAAAISNNIYGEQPYGSPDGRRILITRCQDYCWDEEAALLVHDLDTLRITMAVPRMRSGRGVFTSAWSGLVYYWTPDRKLMQLSLTTLEQKEVYAEDDPAAPLLGSSLVSDRQARNDYLDRFGHAPLPAASVSPDQRYVIGMAPRLSGRGAPVFQIIRLDLKRKRRDVIFEHPEISNPHLQFNPVTGRQILVQNNEGLRLRRDNSLRQRRAVECRLFVIDTDGKNQRFLPIGPPTTAGGTGHECFLGGTGRVLASAGWVSRSLNDWRHSPRHPHGNLFTAAPGDRRPICFHAPEHLFNHVSASRDGRFFVADSMPASGLFRNGVLHHASLVVGCIASGKHRVLVQDSQASGGGNQCTHTHPYFTADSRHVIYNADPDGIPQVFAARLPDGFLAGLE
jgi:hypothetical protein